MTAKEIKKTYEQKNIGMCVRTCPGGYPPGQTSPFYAIRVINELLRNWKITDRFDWEGAYGHQGKKLLASNYIDLDLCGYQLWGKNCRRQFQPSGVAGLCGNLSCGVLSACLCQISTALISQLFVGIRNPIVLLYSITAAAVALAFRYCRKNGHMNALTKAVIASFWIGIMCVVISTPLNVIFYTGYSGNTWGDALVDMLQWYNVPLIPSSIAGELIVEVVDKQICVTTGYFLIRGAEWLKRKKFGNLSGKALPVFLLSMCLPLLLPASRAYAAENTEQSADFPENYISTVYDNTTGMLSAEANVVEQTDDGCIWIGSYAGLTRYNGVNFEFVRDGGIVNVTAMHCDTKGNLWIGTNDGGAARYCDGSFTFFTKEDGLSSNSIRSFAEDENGTIYLGTLDGICCFDKFNTITVVNPNIDFVISMLSMGDGTLAAVDNAGDLYILKHGEIIQQFEALGTTRMYYCIKDTSKGILVGTSDGSLKKLETKNGKWALTDTSYQVSGEINMIMEDKYSRIWICSSNGYGYLNDEGIFVNVTPKGQESNYEWIMEDYQGNIWLTSNRGGVTKLSESRFSMLFGQGEIENVVVNAVVEYDSMYYCATDSGLIIMDREKNYIENELTDYLSDVRIRHLMVDSKNRLWISTYGEMGLVRYTSSGEQETYNIAEKGSTSDRFRCALALSDGTVIAGTADGINFIKEDQVVNTLTAEKDHLPNSQILTLVEAGGGTLYAGSDGGGIYVIRDEKIQDIYTVKDGLSSDIILRIVPYKNGFFVVTGNALCYMEGGNIRRLESFPYFNNYDVIIKDSMAYVLSSAGIYEVDAEQLRADTISQYTLKGTNDGLMVGLTANSWSYVDASGSLVLCSNNGVVLYECSRNSSWGTYRYGIRQIECDSAPVYDGNNKYILPDDVKDVTLHAYVNNYTLNNVKVRFFVEGMGDIPAAVSFRDLQPIQLFDLSGGEHVVHLQILDSAGINMMEEKTYILERKIQFWERTSYRFYLAFVCVELIVFTTWTILSMYNISKKKRELEQIRKELEEKVGEQVKEIKEKEERENILFQKMIIALSDTVDAKDRYTSGHSRRVADYSRRIAIRMHKSEEEQTVIYYAGLLHDVGKIRIPGSVINKQAKLTDEEYELMKIHPVTSYHILKNISKDNTIALGAKSHHERFDGRGYPNGLAGMNIPEIARIIGVADAYDAMASNRSYRKALPQDVVRGELVKGKGIQFDPDIAEIMITMLDEDKEYLMMICCSFMRSF